MTARAESLAAADRVIHGAGSEADKQMVCGDFILLAAQVGRLVPEARDFVLNARGPFDEGAAYFYGKRRDALLARLDAVGLA